MPTCYRHPDRETGVSCSECGRPICPDCMTVAPVGIRCPDHAGGARPAPAQRMRMGVRRAAGTADEAIAVKVLIGLNVLVFLANLAQGASLGRNDGQLFFDGALIGQLVADGEWWRLLTAAFLHGSLLHLGFNMLLLWWIGTPMELALGRARFVALYLVSGLAGSAGALLLSPGNVITVGASGAIFGLLGAALVFERQRHYVLGGSALTIVVLNLVFTFAVPNVSIGGHVGGLAGGALVGLAMSRFGRGHALYGRPGVLGVAGVVGVGLLSVAVAYFRVQGYA